MSSDPYGGIFQTPAPASSPKPPTTPAKQADPYASIFAGARTPGVLHPSLANLAGSRQIGDLRFVVSSTTGGAHNVGSVHPRGLAMDVVPLDPKQWDQMRQAFISQGYHVRDERLRPKGQKVWTGAHLHVQVREGPEAAARAARVERQFVTKPVATRLVEAAGKQQKILSRIVSWREGRIGIAPELRNQFNAAVNELAATATTGPVDPKRFLKLGKVVLTALSPLAVPAEMAKETLPISSDLLRKAGLPESSIVAIDTVLGAVMDIELDPSNVLLGSPLIMVLKVRAAARAGQGMAAAQAVARSARELAQTMATPNQAKVLNTLADQVAPAAAPPISAPAQAAQAEAVRPSPPPRGALPPELGQAPVRLSSGATVTVDELEAMSRTRAPEFEARLRAIAQATGTRYGPDVQPKLAQTTVKSRDSILAKASREDPVDDALRQTLVVDDLAINPARVNEILSNLEARGFKIVGVKNRFELGEAAGYKDVNIKMVFEDDPRFVTELQLITPKVLEAKVKIGHDLYDFDTKYLPPLKALLGDDPRLAKLQQRIADAQKKLYEGALAEDRAAAASAAKRVPAAARTSISKAAVSAGKPAVRASTEVAQKVLAAKSARRLASVPAAPSAIAAPPTPSIAPALGRESKAVGARGTQISTRLAIVDARDLQPSHTFAGTELVANPRYPQELQPRLRERAASVRQVENFIEKIDPARLADDPSIARGAPIVGEDLLVESGNARTLGLARAYELNHPRATAYRQWLSDNVKALGIEPGDLARMERPILVRIRTSPVDRLAFVREANEGARAAMSAVEQARSDATTVSDDLMALFRPSETGEIVTPANRDFIEAFLRDIVAPADLPRYLTAGGGISQDAITRIRNAIFAKAFGDISAIEKLAEATDVNVRNIITGMLRAAPRLASIKSRIAQGALHPLDLTDDITDAMNALSTLRETGTPVDVYLRQQPLFGAELSDEARTLLEIFGRTRSQKAVADILNRYADLVEAAGDPRQVSILGTLTPPAKVDVLERAIAGEGAAPSLELPLQRQAVAERLPEPSTPVREVPAAPAALPTPPRPAQRPRRTPPRAPLVATAEDLASLDEFARLQRAADKSEARAIRSSMDQAVREFQAGRAISEPRTRVEVNTIGDRAYQIYRQGAEEPQVDQSFFRRFAAAEILEPEAFGASPAIRGATAANLAEARSITGKAAQAGFIRFGAVAPAGPSGMPPAVRQAIDLGRPGTRQKMAQSWEKLRNTVVNYFTFEGQVLGARTAPGHTWQELRDDFRLFKDVPRIDVPRKTIDDIAGVVSPLQADEYGKWSDFIVLRDWVEEVEVAARGGRRASVPFGLPEDELRAALADADRALTSNARAAVVRYDRLKDAQRAEFLRRGMGDAEEFRRFHFRHFVMDYDELYGGTIGMPRGRLREPFRKALKERAGSERAILTDPIDVLNKEFSRFYIDNAVDDFFTEIKPKVDWLPHLSKDQKIALFGPSGKPNHTGQLVTLEDGTQLITWQYHPGNRVFPAYSLSGRITEAATTRTLTIDELQTLVKDLEPDVRAAAQMLVLGAKYPMILIDPKVAARLNQMVSGGATDRMFRHVEGLTGVWKRALIDSLGLPFQMQNMIGDLENGMVIGGKLPTSGLGRAIVALTKRELGRPLSVTEQRIINTAERLRVVRSGFVGGFLKRNPRLDSRLRHLLDPGERIARLPEEALTVYERAASVREDAARLAHFWDNLDRIAQGEQIRTSGAIDIRGLIPERAAAKVAREAFVDYGGRSPFEDQFRQVLAPFVTWFYQNTRNWARLTVRNPKQLAVKSVPLYAAMLLWNNTGDRAEIESGLPKWRRATPHIITGWELPDGRPLIISLQTAASSAAQATGLTRLFELGARVARGELALDTAVRKAPAEMGQEALRGIAFSLGPGVTVPAEVLIYGTTAAAGKPVALDIRRGVSRIPERLRGTRAGLRQFIGEEARQIVPPAEILLRQREAGRTVPPGTSAATRAAMATGLVRPVDLSTEQRARGIEAAELAEADLEDKLYRIEQAFVRGGEKEAAGTLRAVNKEAGPKIRPNDMMRRLTGTRVQIERVRELLRTARTEEDARRLRKRLEALLRRSTLERRRQVPMPARPYAVPP